MDSRRTFTQMEDGLPLGSGDSHVVTLEPLTVSVIEAEDVLFHHDSAVLLPTNPAGRSSQDGQTSRSASVQTGQQLITGIGVIYAVYRFLEAYPEKKLIIAGHTDTSGEARYNFQLSAFRAKSALYMLTGEKDLWASNCYDKHKIEDVQQILKHFSEVFYWPCDPGSVDNIMGSRTREALQRFQETYNSRRQELELADSSEIPIQGISGGKLNQETWGAFFHLYIWQMAGMLDCTPDDAGMNPWRSRVQFVDDNCKFLMCGESFPVADADRSNYRSQLNRRVEFLFFDPDEVPTFTCLQERNTVYTIEECPIYNSARYQRRYVDPQQTYLAWIELQTVDEFGHSIGNVELILRHQQGTTADIEVRTDEDGYWSRHHVPTGIYDILLPDGTPLMYVAEGREFPATLNTDIARDTITSVVAERNATEEEREERGRQQQIYGRSGEERRSGASEGRGGEERRTRRSWFVATDNLSLAAGWADDYGSCDEARLLQILDTWLGDYFPTARRRGYFVIAIIGRTVRFYDSNQARQGEFTLTQDIQGAFGAYATFEQGDAAFRDMATRSVGLRPSAYLEDIVNDPDGIRALEEQRQGQVRILYNIPSAAQLGYLGLVGGTGRFEDYGRNATVNQHVHERNLAVARSVHTGYESVLDVYVQRVERATSSDAIRALGPPPEPYIFPRPVGSTMDQYREILDALDVSSYRAWLAISQRLDVLAGRIPEGTIFFRVKFTLKENVGYGSTSPYAEVKTEWNFDVSEHGVFQRRSTTATAGVRGEIRRGRVRIGGGANHEIDLESGETKTTVQGSFGRWGTEISDDGGMKVTGPYGVSSEANARTGEFGFGGTFSLQDLMRQRRESRGETVPDNAFQNIPNAELYLGLHFQGIRQETLLAYFSRAPGFFERRSLSNLLAPSTQWSDLDGDERAHLTTLGWNAELWDQKHLLPLSRYPDSARANPHDLPAAERIAIVHLGFSFDQWTATWRRVAGAQR